MARNHILWLCSPVTLKLNFGLYSQRNITTNETFEYSYPLHEISNNVVYATSDASDQPAHMRSLIRSFASL